MTEKNFTCEVCGRSFNIYSNLKRHIKTIHCSDDEVLKLFKCEECGKSFNVQSYLNSHVRAIHSNNRFICEVCGKTFNFRSNLDTHIKTLHSSTKAARFTCPECKKTFNIRSNLSRHIKNIHSDNKYRSKQFICEICVKEFSIRSNLEMHIKTIHSSERFACDICAKTFRLHSKLDKHIKNKHSNNTKKTIRIKCVLCNNIFSTIDFNNHFPVAHNIKLEAQELVFQSEFDFNEWKKFVEEQETASYVKMCGPTSTKSFQKIIHYKCHRSGYYRKRFLTGIRQRALKKQGTSKIDSYCPARIKAMFCNDGSIKVMHCSTHVGHEMEMEHLSIPLEDRKELATKITAKIPFESIIQDIQSSAPINLHRTHLIKKQDLRNIVRDFSLDSSYIPKRKYKRHNIGVKVANKNIKLETVEQDNLHLDELKKRVSEECSLILSKVSSCKQIDVMLNNFQTLKTDLDSSELGLGAVETFPDVTQQDVDITQEMDLHAMFIKQEKSILPTIH